MATANSNDIQRFTIVKGAGPSKLALLTALAYAYGDVNEEITAVPVSVKFKAYRGTKETSMAFHLYARIIGLTHENGSGESFNLEGYIRTNSRGSAHVSREERHFTGYYDVHHKEGTLDIENPDDEWLGIKSFPGTPPAPVSGLDAPQI